MERKKIMVVDDNITSLNVTHSALEKNYDVFLMPGGEKALEVITKINPDLVLLDVEMPDMDGFEVIEKIKQLGYPYDEIPVIFVTEKDDPTSEFEGFNLGAVDYIIKPFSFSLLLKRIELHLRLHTQQQQIQDYSLNLESMVAAQIDTIQNLQYAIVHTLGDIVERRDGSTGAHLLRTSEYLKILLTRAKELNVYDGILNDASVKEYSHACQLHDIGKVSIPDGILLKTGRLTPAEYDIMKTHTTAGELALEEAMKFVDNSAFLEVAHKFVSSHHEKWDGSGYPRGLKGEEIPICGRLMAIADVYDALISTRPYKPAISHEQTLEIMYDGIGQHFDPVLMDVFKEIHLQFKGISEKYRDQSPKRVEQEYD